MPEQIPHRSHEREERPRESLFNAINGAFIGFLGGMALKESVADFIRSVRQRVAGVHDLAAQAGKQGVGDDALISVVGQKHLQKAKQFAQHTQDAWYSLSPDRGNLIEAMETSRGDLEKALRSEKMIGRIPGGTFTILAASTALGAVIGYVGYKMLHNREERKNAVAPRGPLERIETEQRTSAAIRER